MKILLLTFSILFSITSFSQAYLSMLEEDHYWHVYTYDYFSEIGYTTVFYYSGDIQINGSFYKQLYRNNFARNYFVREENGVLYRYDNATNSDLIIFDFTLDVGDVFTFDENAFIYGGGDGFGLFNEIEVVNVYHENIAGMNRKIIEFTHSEANGEITETWYEGIGNDLAGIEAGGYPQEASVHLSCFTDEGITYSFYSEGDCVLSTNEIAINKINLHPNPVTNISTVEIPKESAINRIKIYDVRGRLLRNELLFSNYTVENSDYTPGIYIYHLLSEEKIVKTDKFIVK